MFYEDFSVDPPYFGYNSAGQENPILRLSFMDLPGLKLTWDFWSVNILSRETPKEEEVNKTRPRGRTSTGGMGPLSGTPPMLVGASSLRYHPSSSPDAHLELKTRI
jgi:hypothetical protein